MNTDTNSNTLATKRPFSFGAGFNEGETSGQGQMTMPQNGLPQLPGMQGQNGQMSPEMQQAFVQLLQHYGKALGVHTAPAYGFQGTNAGGSITANKETGDIGLDYLHAHRDESGQPGSFQRSSVGGPVGYDPAARNNSMMQARSAGIFQHPTAQVGSQGVPDQTIMPQNPFANYAQLGQFEGQHGMPQGSLPGGGHTILSPYGFGFRNS